MNFDLLIIGSDINAYQMARSYYEAYKKKAYLIGNMPMAVTYYSKILNFKLVDGLLSTTTFLNELKEFYELHSDSKILLLGSTNDFVRLIIENQEELKKYYIFHEYDIEVLNAILNKEKFYNEFKDIDKIDTYIYDINTDLNLYKINDIGYPLSISLGTDTVYHELNVQNKQTIYIANDIYELLDIISKIRNLGYKKSLIIQKKLDNDNNILFDCVSYIDRHKKVALMSFAQIGLQEYDNEGNGKATVLVNGFNEYENPQKTLDNLKNTLEHLGYSGCLYLKLLYNKSNKKYEVIEIKPRQSRSSYYLTAIGYNLITYLVDDLIYKRNFNYVFAKNKVCLSFVSKKIINKYVESNKLKNEIDRLYKNKKYVNPIKFRKDNPIKRIVWLKTNDLNYSKIYKNRGVL